METDANRYTALPLGGVIYDGSTASKNNHNMIGSKNVFSEYGGGGDGYFFGDHGWQKRRGGDWDDLDPQFQSMNPDTLAAIEADSIKQGWGPLVGNPSKKNSPEADTGRPWMQGLRYNEADGSFFWYRDKAPGWATLNDDQVRLSQAITDYKAAVSAAAAEAAANAAQAILDQQQADALAKQQAAEDVAQQHQITQDQAQAQSEADIQSKADEVAARQQQAADESSIRQAQAQAEIDRAAQQQAFDQQVSLVQQGILPPEALVSPGGEGGDGGFDDEGFPVGDQFDAEGFPVGPTYNPLAEAGDEDSVFGHPLYMRPLDQR
jgi:pyruvate/2-oxoglutarate dehydrogenase complex dihydrolipoamide acyltransferase (E2) component